MAENDKISASEGRRYRYSAFISYSHREDKALAAALQRALQTLAQPWYQWRAIPIYRDETDLSCSPDGWASIEARLNESQFLVLLCSPLAAQSKWVRKEVETWAQRPDSHESLILVLTAGELHWEDKLGQFSQYSDALPQPLMKFFDAEPLWADLSWAKRETQLQLGHPDFKLAVARIAAKIRGLDLATLVDQDLHQVRTRQWLARAAFWLIFLLGLGAAWLLCLQGQVSRGVERKLGHFFRRFGRATPGSNRPRSF
ncbi:MAG: TIR domain-containing protein [Vulcanimicrobiota bacterium]